MLGCLPFAIAAGGLGGFFVKHKTNELDEILAEAGEADATT
jgi:hypothetical protein